MFCERHLDTDLGSANINDPCPLCTLEAAAAQPFDLESVGDELYLAAKDILGYISAPEHHIPTNNLRIAVDRYGAATAKYTKSGTESEK